ncbi:PREDICTED: microtubule-actin cross-linking factor 1-like [Papilio polytes]|uniref:microtubule-actin cross-linking factor 1-like n=1 Tax=Papilio polytes TaxID=76194 RepID=UPI0006762091|nr:PREDICTED: microtubule-actin cross-linking factor 1-like [Papilio polytes]
MESEPLPESIELLEGLIEDHKELMEHTQKRQNEVDRVCKAYQVKSQSQGRETTTRKVSAKSATKGTPGYAILYLTSKRIRLNLVCFDFCFLNSFVIMPFSCTLDT